MTRRWGPIFVGAALVRAAFWWWVTPGWTPRSDAFQYLELSRALADGHGFQLVFPQLELHPTAFRPPLYPVLLTPGSWLFGDALWPARLLSLILGSLVAVLAGVLAARIAGRRSGVCAAAIVALYPPLLANDTVSLTEPLALALLLGAVLMVDHERWLAGGVLTGMLMLTRPNAYLVLVVLAIWCWRKVDLVRAGALVLAAMVLFFPWLVRNQVQVGTWRPTTSDGFNLAAIYSAPAQRAGGFVDPVFDPAFGDPEHRLARFDEPTWSRLLTEDAIDGLQDDPGYVLHILWRNVRSLFEISPRLNLYAERNDGRNLDFVNATRPIFYVVTIAGLAGLLRRRRDPRVVVMAALVAQFVVLSLVIVAPSRLRAPFDLLCCVGAGLLLGGLLDQFFEHRPTGHGTAAACHTEG